VRIGRLGRFHGGFEVRVFHVEHPTFWIRGFGLGVGLEAMERSTWNIPAGLEGGQSR
jgi:hypothetical protein